MRIICLLCVGLIWSGCSLIMSGKDVDEHIRLMQERNASGCAYIAGSGTPPASRVDGGVVGGWGEGMTVDQMLVCVDKLKELKN